MRGAQPGTHRNVIEWYSTTNNGSGPYVACVEGPRGRGADFIANTRVAAIAMAREWLGSYGYKNYPVTVVERV